MTYQEAIKILDPLTSVNTLTKIEYYGGFHGKQVAAAKYVEACKLACQAMRAIEHQKQENPLLKVKTARPITREINGGDIYI